MPDQQPDTQSASAQRLRALSRWDDEGGAGPQGPQVPEAPFARSPDMPDLSQAELIQLRVRVIALENLMIMLLAEGSDRQLQAAREMAAYISPRSGSAHHPLTLQAATQMVHLVDRAVHYRGGASS